MLRYGKRKTCDCCGIDESLETDHIKEEHSDNSDGYRQALCKHCHMQKGKMGLPLFDYIKELCWADRRMKATMQQGSRRWLRQAKDYRSKPKGDNARLPLFVKEHEPYTDKEFKLIISTFVRGNPAIYNE